MQITELGISGAFEVVPEIQGDARVGSASYGSWEPVRLDDVERKAVYVGEGLGHALTALADGSVVHHLCSMHYAPDERGIDPLDPEIGIEWPVIDRDGQPLRRVLSVKDQEAPSLAEARQRGLLSSYEEAQSFVASLR